MEIERKFLIKKEKLPENLSQYPCLHIEQGYLCTDPVVRIRRQNDEYYLTYKSKGLLLAEVEFSSEEAAKSYMPPAWFGEDVTYSSKYHNSTLSKGDWVL